jgi:hypothetical protein
MNRSLSLRVSGVRGGSKGRRVSTKVQSLAIPEGMHAIKIRADAKFWRHWRGSPDQMGQIGYRCRKVGGRWHAWLLVPDEESTQPDLFRWRH